MKLFEREGRPSPYGVTYQHEGRQARRFFKTKAARDTWLAEHGMQSHAEGFSMIEWCRWLSLKDECRIRGVTPEQMVAQFAKLTAGAVRQFPAVAIETAVAEFIASRSERSPDYVSHLKSTLARDLVEFVRPGTVLADIGPERLQGFVSRFGHWATTRNHRAYVRALWNFAVEKGWVDSNANPARKLTVPKRPASDRPGILTPAEMRAVFEANAGDKETCALLALGAFAGLRSANIARLDPEATKPSEIRIADRQLFIPPEKFKTEKPHLIEGDQVPNLWAWLKQADLSAVLPCAPKEYQRARRVAFNRAGMAEPPKNCLRHSFATYRCALDEHAGKASYILGHAEASEIWDSYKGIATKSDALAYFAITPASISPKPKRRSRR